MRGEITSPLIQRNINPLGLYREYEWISIISLVNIKSQDTILLYIVSNHMRKTPKLVSGMGALRAALRLMASTLLVSAGSITPSSHNLALEKYG